MDAPRKELVALIQPVVDPDWKIVDSDRNVDEIDQTCLQLKQRTIDRQGPGLYAVGFLGTVSTPHTDTQLAEDALDDAVLGLIYALDAITSLSVGTATKVEVASQRLGYDIELTLSTQPEKGTS